MELKLLRYSDDGDSTLGLLFLDDFFFCYTLEDEGREIKIKGETRIPAGTYEIKYRKVLSPATKRYRSKHDWFRWHLELQDVPDFKYVYIHIGNTDDQSDGCILVADTANNNQVMDGFIGRSLKCYKRLYLFLMQFFNVGEKVTIKIMDPDYIKKM